MEYHFYKVNYFQGQVQGNYIYSGGNETVQNKMLSHLQEKRDVKFFTSLSALMQLCTVLDLDAYERSIKAETLGSSAAHTEEMNIKGIDQQC